MGKLIAWLVCLLFGDLSPKDARPAWMVELDRVDRLEAMAVRAIQKKRGRRA